MRTCHPPSAPTSSPGGCKTVAVTRPRACTTHSTLIGTKKHTHAQLIFMGLMLHRGSSALPRHQASTSEIGSYSGCISKRRNYTEKITKAWGRPRTEETKNAGELRQSSGRDPGNDCNVTMRIQSHESVLPSHHAKAVRGIVPCPCRTVLRPPPCTALRGQRVCEKSHWKPQGGADLGTAKTCLFASKRLSQLAVEQCCPSSAIIPTHT